jgi:hypothetical protein
MPVAAGMRGILRAPTTRLVKTATCTGPIARVEGFVGHALFQRDTALSRTTRWQGSLRYSSSDVRVASRPWERNSSTSCFRHERRQLVLVQPTHLQTSMSMCKRRFQHTWPPNAKEFSEQHHYRRHGVLLLCGGSLFLVILYRHATLSSPDTFPTGIEIIPIEPSLTAHRSYPTHSTTEPRLTISSLFRRYILEPILTVVRFLHLAFLFGPVILTSPMLLVGAPGSGGKRAKRASSGVKVEDDERWGAVWWYGFLVKQMERSGPTFIKVSSDPVRLVCGGSRSSCC